MFRGCSPDESARPARPVRQKLQYDRPPHRRREQNECQSPISHARQSFLRARAAIFLCCGPAAKFLPAFSPFRLARLSSNDDASLEFRGRNFRPEFLPPVLSTKKVRSPQCWNLKRTRRESSALPFQSLASL